MCRLVVEDEHGNVGRGLTEHVLKAGVMSLILFS